MINSISSNLNSSAIRPTERNLPSEIRVAQINPEQTDIGIISSQGHEHAQYMQVIGKLPEVRSDVVEKGREQIGNKTKRYPPEDIIAGISILIGDGIQYKNQD